MNYLNLECINAVSASAFQLQKPYPWAQMQDTLTPEGWNKLRATLPDMTKFQQMVGVKRGYGQEPHNRGILHYREGLALAEPWKAFIAELRGKEYESFLRRMLGLAPGNRIILTMEWYYAWQGCSVSPHCDARRKLATHIFYFNTENDWDPDWGGEILILDSEKRFATHSGPSFDELKTAAMLEPWGNESLFFQRTQHSWHGVRPLQCPPGKLRRLFLITVNVPSFQVWWRGVRGKDPDGYKLRQEEVVA